MNIGPQNPAARLKEIEGLVKGKGGKCLSTYKNNYTRVDLQCAKEHNFALKPKHIKDGVWCPVCAAEAASLRELEQKKRVLAYIESNGGKMFGPYKNARTKITVECASGHRWTPWPDNLLSKETWCPFCRSQKPRERRKRTGLSVPILV